MAERAAVEVYVGDGAVTLRMADEVFAYLTGLVAEGAAARRGLRRLPAGFEPVLRSLVAQAEAARERVASRVEVQPVTPAAPVPGNEMTTAEVADLYGVSTKTVTRRAHELGGRQLGGAGAPWLFDRSTVLAAWPVRGRTRGHMSSDIVRRSVA